MTNKSAAEFLITLTGQAEGLIKNAQKQLIRLETESEEELRTAEATRDVALQGIELKLTCLDQEQAEAMKAFNLRRDEIRGEQKTNQVSFEQRAAGINKNLIRERTALTTLIVSQQAALNQLQHDNAEPFTVIEGRSITEIETTHSA